jgi:hypothetical protein
MERQSSNNDEKMILMQMCEEVSLWELGRERESSKGY